MIVWRFQPAWSYAVHRRLVLIVGRARGSAGPIERRVDQLLLAVAVEIDPDARDARSGTRSNFFAFHGCAWRPAIARSSSAPSLFAGLHGERALERHLRDAVAVDVGAAPDSRSASCPTTMTWRVQVGFSNQTSSACRRRIGDQVELAVVVDVGGVDRVRAAQFRSRRRGSKLPRRRGCAAPTAIAAARRDHQPIDGRSSTR